MSDWSEEHLSMIGYIETLKAWTHPQGTNSASRSAYASGFPRLAELPRELRDMIWACALPPRRIIEHGPAHNLRTLKPGNEKYCECSPAMHELLGAGGILIDVERFWKLAVVCDVHETGDRNHHNAGRCLKQHLGDAKVTDRFIYESCRRLRDSCRSQQYPLEVTSRLRPALMFKLCDFDPDEGPRTSHPSR